MKIDKPGIYRDFDVAAYHDDCCPEPSFSQSIGKILIDRSPLHAAVAHPRLTVPDDVDDDEAEKYVKAKVIGDAAHMLMIGRGKSLAVAPFDNWRGGKASDFRDDVAVAGKLAILQKHFAQAECIVRAARTQIAGHQENTCFMNGEGEVALIWQEGPLWFRCLVDWLHADMRTVDDYKTSGMSVAPHVIGLRAAEAGWEIQAAMIERGLDVLDPDNAGRRRYRFIAQEQDAPHCLNVMVMTEHWMTLGRKKLQHAIDLWAHAMRTKQWPGYPPFAVTPEYPGFKETQWLAREISDAAQARVPRENFNPKNVMAG